MFASVLRNQARIALVLSRNRLPTISQRAYTTLPHIRLLSTFLPRQQNYTDNGLPNHASEENILRTAHPPSPTIWVGNMPFSSDEAELREKFSGFGELVNIRLGHTPDGRFRGFAHIDFASQEEAIKAVEACGAEPIYMQDRNLRVDFAPQKTNYSSPPHNKLYIRDFHGDEDDIRAAFQEFKSNIVGVHIMRNPQTGASQNVGFVEFINVDCATQARDALNGIEFAPGAKLLVEFARKRPLRRDSRGGFTGRGSSGFSGSRGGRDSDWGGGGGQRGSDYGRGKFFWAEGRSRYGENRGGNYGEGGMP